MLLGGIFSGSFSIWEKNFYRHPSHHIYTHSTHARARSLTLNSQIHADYLKIHMENIHASAWLLFVYVASMWMCVCAFVCVTGSTNIHTTGNSILLLWIFMPLATMLHMFRIVTSRFVRVHYYYYTIRTSEFKRVRETSCTTKRKKHRRNEI